MKKLLPSKDEMRQAIYTSITLIVLFGLITSIGAIIRFKMFGQRNEYYRQGDMRMMGGYGNKNFEYRQGMGNMMYGNVNRYQNNVNFTGDGGNATNTAPATTQTK